MAETTTNTKDDTSQQQEQQPQSQSLTSTLHQTLPLLETNPTSATQTLATLQTQIAHSSVFSSNETLEDISTSFLPLLAVEHYLAMSLLNAPTTRSSSFLERKQSVVRAMELFHFFLRRCEVLGLLSEEKELLKDYHVILDSDEQLQQHSSENGGGGGGRKVAVTMTGAQIREAKITRFRLKKQTNAELQHLQALQERRTRLNFDKHEEMDGYDDESLERNVSMKVLKCCVVDALEELGGCVKEMEMIEMMVEMERRRGEMERHRGGGGERGNQSSNMPGMPQQQNQPPPPRSNKPMEVTRVTQNPQTGQLQFKKEQIRSGVFKPSWNQPTMSLRELGDIERAQAMERSEKQKQAEKEALNQPRRYDQLVRDGMEDDADLVDASAKLDREWDNFKDENPRGSGNKMGDRGDRNF